MIVYEFYLKDAEKGKAFDALCDSFCKIPNPIIRKVDGATGSAVYAVSRNPNTQWVQLLVDDNTPANILNAIEAKIEALSDQPCDKRTFAYHNVAPSERKRTDIKI